MAAAIVAIRKHHSEILPADEESEQNLLDHLRSNVPSKENRDAEHLLRVSVLG